jgi:dTDP-D-glucose 4,6-dehydratase
VLSIEKARRELRWTPEMTLETGLRATYDWLLRQRGWQGPGDPSPRVAAKQTA